MSLGPARQDTRSDCTGVTAVHAMDPHSADDSVGPCHTVSSLRVVGSEEAGRGIARAGGGKTRKGPIAFSTNLLLAPERGEQDISRKEGRRLEVRSTPQNSPLRLRAPAHHLDGGYALFL
jgi:hypothetical protein